MEYYTLTSEREREIVTAYGERYGLSAHGDRPGPASLAEDEIRATCVANDWPEGDEHQTRLNTAPAGEIAVWIQQVNG